MRLPDHSASDWAATARDAALSAHPEKGLYTTAAGISPSGVVHFGNFRDIVTSHLVREEFVRQGKQALQSWLHRYGAAMEQDGADLAPVRKIAAGQPSRVAVPAA